MVDRPRSVSRRRQSTEDAAEPTLRKYLKMQLRPSRLWPVLLGGLVILLWRFTPDQIEVILALIIAFAALTALLVFLVRRD
jgi:hypothetical protein